MACSLEHRVPEMYKKGLPIKYVCLSVCGCIHAFSFSFIHSPIRLICENTTLLSCACEHQIPEIRCLQAPGRPYLRLQYSVRSRIIQFMSSTTVLHIINVCDYYICKLVLSNATSAAHAPISTAQTQQLITPTQHWSPVQLDSTPTQDERVEPS